MAAPALYPLPKVVDKGKKTAALRQRLGAELPDGVEKGLFAGDVERGGCGTDLDQLTWVERKCRRQGNCAAVDAVSLRQQAGLHRMDDKGAASYSGRADGLVVGDGDGSGERGC